MGSIRAQVQRVAKGGGGRKTQGRGKHIIRPLIAILCVCGSNFYRSLAKSCNRPPRCAISLRSKIASERRFSLRWKRAKSQAPPSYGSGRYGFGVFGAQDSGLRDRCSVGTRHAFFSVTFLSIWAVSRGGQSSVTRSGIPGPKNPKSSATKTTTWHCLKIDSHCRIPCNTQVYGENR